MNNFSDILYGKTDLSDKIISKLEKFNDILYEKNKVLNLTRVKKEESVYRNFLDSLNPIALNEIKNAKKVIDIGSGSGFPGIALAIVFENISFTLVEATGKKAEFLKEAAELLDLANVSVISKRAEDLAHDALYREKYDIVTARAVAGMTVLCEITSGFAKVGGKLVFYKGRNANEEIKEANYTFEKLKIKNAKAENYLIKSDEDELFMITLNKYRALPPEYPRSYSKIIKDSKK